MNVAFIFQVSVLLYMYFGDCGRYTFEVNVSYNIIKMNLKVESYFFFIYL